MFLSKRKNGYYYVIYTNSKGNRTLKSTYTKKKTEAFRYLINFEQSLEQNKNCLPELSLFNFAIKYMRYSEANHSSLTSRDYQITFKKFRSFLGNSNITDITTEMIQSFITTQIKTASIYQARKDLINLKASFNWIIKQKYLNVNPAKDIKRIKLPEKLPVYFTKDEFNALLNIIDNEDLKDLIVVSVNTGMRQGEIINLRWSSIDFDKQIISLDNKYFLNKSRRVRNIPFNNVVSEVLRKCY